MAPSIHEPDVQLGPQAGERERREPGFQRSPWAHVTCGEGKNPKITMWDGVKAIVVSLSFPDGIPGDLQISIAETCLMLGGAARGDSAGQSIDFPCPVETRPIRIEDEKGTIYFLLRKK